jgi:hypothetical protein
MVWRFDETVGGLEQLLVENAVEVNKNLPSCTECPAEAAGMNLWLSFTGQLCVLFLFFDHSE